MRLGMPISTEISIFGHANGLPFSKQVRRGMRAPFNLEDARIPRLTYTWLVSYASRIKEEGEKDEEFGKLLSLI